MSVYALTTLGTKNLRDTATADERTGVDEEESVGEGQSANDQKVGQSEDQIPARRVADQVHSAQFVGERVQNGQVAVDRVVERSRELVLGSHAVLYDEQRVACLGSDPG